MTDIPIPGSPVPNQFCVTLHASADFDAHIAALRDEIAAANASRVNGDQTFVQSWIVLDMKALAIYGGRFSPRVVQWIRAQEAVKVVSNDRYSGLD